MFAPLILVTAGTRLDPVVSLATDDPTQLLNDLTGWALANDVRLQALQVSQPSLEDVYLRLTGKADDSLEMP